MTEESLRCHSNDTRKGVGAWAWDAKGDRIISRGLPENPVRAAVGRMGRLGMKIRQIAAAINIV